MAVGRPFIAAMKAVGFIACEPQVWGRGLID
jgi:hypothetical protein